MLYTLNPRLHLHDFPKTDKQIRHLRNWEVESVTIDEGKRFGKTFDYRFDHTNVILKKILERGEERQLCDIFQIPPYVILVVCEREL